MVQGSKTKDFWELPKQINPPFPRFPDFIDPFVQVSKKELPKEMLLGELSTLYTLEKFGKFPPKMFTKVFLGPTFPKTTGVLKVLVIKEPF